MSKLQDLINALCPDGVEYKKLETVVSTKRGRRVVRKQLSKIDGYPVYQNSLSPLGYHTESNYPANTTFVIVAGAAGEIGYSEVDFWAADDCFAVVCPPNVSNRYIYYVLLNRQQEIKQQVRKASIPRLSHVAIDKLSIPVPPLPVQTEIVRILDRFTEVRTNLINSLRQELENKRKIYE